MSDVEEKVYKYLLSHNGKILASRCAAELDVPLEAVKEAIQSLSQKGKIRRSATRSSREIEQLIHEKEKVQTEINGLPGRVASSELSLQEYEVRWISLEKWLKQIEKELFNYRRLSSSTMPQSPSILSMKPNEVAELLNERDRIVKWIDNLDSKRSTLSELVFNQVEQDYSSRLTAVKKFLVGSLEGLHKLLEHHQHQQEQLSYEIENLKARHVSGEVEERSYKIRKIELESIIKQATKEIMYIQEILERMD